MVKENYWETTNIEIMIEGDICLKGELKYWEKDFIIHLNEPIRSAVYSRHLAYTIPSIFVYDKKSDETYIKDDHGRIRVNLYPRIEKELKRLYLETLEKNSKTKWQRFIEIFMRRIK